MTNLAGVDQSVTPATAPKYTAAEPVWPQPDEAATYREWAARREREQP